VTIDGSLCFETNQVILQPGNYFGVSAQTADMPDHHQLRSFKVTPLESTDTSPPAAEVTATVPATDKVSVCPLMIHVSNLRMTSRIR